MNIPSVIRFTSGLLNEKDKYKLIQDNVHGTIKVYPEILKIMHTPEFQRLHNIKQLGFCYFVYPTAKHTRFEHLLGTYHLGTILLANIRKKYPDMEFKIPELNITTKLNDQICIYILIALITHDIAQGGFSHTFDDIVMKNSNHHNAHHEARSVLIMKEICGRELDYKEPELNFIGSLINPKSQHTGVIYQIVSNSKNTLDLDKFDYLKRDPTNIGLKFKFDPSRILEEFIIKDNNIIYSKHVSWDILNCFITRYNLHLIVYHHKTVKIIECMYSDILKLIDPIFKISDCVADMKEFIKYTDETIFKKLENSIEDIESKSSKYNDDEIKILYKAYQIYQNILNRKLYKSIFYSNKVTMQVAQLFVNSLNLKATDFEIMKVEIGFASKKVTDPFKNIYFYDDPNDEPFTLDKTSISGILNGDYTETKILLICKNLEIVDTVKTAWKKLDIK
jgi:deoxynucleoside triphosphate triphosphohydrolase SAMHD1